MITIIIIIIMITIIIQKKKRIRQKRINKTKKDIFILDDLQMDTLFLILPK